MTEHTDAHLVPVDAARVQAITVPAPELWTLFIIYSVLSNLALPIVILPFYFKYKTLRYRFDDDGVSVSYGLIWRRETYLTYARIQDIHVTRNIFERWLGIGTVQIQTASGSAAATESIIGLTEFQDVRNYLYARMRGHHGGAPRAGRVVGAASGAITAGADARADVNAGEALAHRSPTNAAGAVSAGTDSTTVEALTGIRDELRAMRALLEAQRADSRDV